MESLSKRHRVRKRRIEKKYDKLIAETIKRMKESTMGELWAELDKLKAQMREDYKKAGVLIESQ